jgi:RNA polymerase sigma-70 factor (ECF subfamily)
MVPMDESSGFVYCRNCLAPGGKFLSQPFIGAPRFSFGERAFQLRGMLLEGELVEQQQVQWNPESALADPAGSQSDSTNELHLVTRAQCGDEESFGRLVQPHMRKAFCTAFKITRNREDAEDVAQQAMLNAFLHIHQFRGRSRFSTWLLRIVMNEALMRVRRRQSEAKYLCLDPDSDQRPSFLETLPAEETSHPEVLYSKAERRETLWQAIEGLSKRLRVVVCALGLQERKAKEAARMLDLSQSAVKTRFLRARQQLRQCLAERACT